METSISRPQTTDGGPLKLPDGCGLLSMAFDNETGTLRIRSERGGTITEITTYLHDLENAYNRIYLFENFAMTSYFDPRSRRFRRRFPFWEDFGLSLVSLTRTELSSDFILPDERLTIQRIRIESPGFWEFAGSLNPLQQIREYLNDRHRRRQDREYREQSEREKLSLENELLQRQLFEKDNSIWRERIELLRDLGFSNDEIRSLVWANIGKPLAELGKHQDTRLIDGAE